jgi:hypothetical protein
VIYRTPADVEAIVVAELRRLRADGKTLEQISELMNIGPHAISRLVKKYQIPANTVHAQPGGVRRQLRRL